MNEELLNKLNSSAPKRILSLDGGGIRGILTLGMLQKIEKLIKAKNSNFSICDYYDLISGTSTGAIIACCLAVGMPVKEITNLYLNLGKEIFGKGRKHRFLRRNWTTIRAIFSENYSSAKLEKYLYNTFKDIHLGDGQNIKCGLAINCKRADTYSLWTVANHPRGKYFEANSCLKLWELCRASSAAPYYFKPKKLSLKTRSGASFEATFIDGGVSLANNPAWQTFLTATTPSFGYSWKPGTDNISITTLGTGNGQTKEDAGKLEQLKTIMWAPKLSDLFMVDALEMNQVILETVGYNAGSHFSIDSQFGDLTDITLIEKQNKLFTFQRHNVTLTEKALKDLKVPLDEKVETYKEMDYYENMEKLLKIGQIYADNYITGIL